MEIAIGMLYLIGAIAIAILGFCLFISPLMIWKHTKATSRKLDKLINLLSEKKA